MPAATNPTRSTPVSAAAGSSGSAPDSGTSSSSSSSNSGFEQPGPGAQFNNSSAEGRIAIGSLVRCVFEGANGSLGKEYQGEVIAVEQKKVLMIKSQSSCGRNSLSNLHMVNIALPNCKIQVLSGKKDPLPDLPSLNIARLNNRLGDQVEKKKKQVMAFKSGVSPSGQRLFLSIGKTLDDVVWNGENISVMKEVTIYPPYRSEDVKGNTDSQLYKHVCKIVEKHLADQQLQHPSPSPSPHRTADPPGSTGASETPSFTASGGGGSKAGGHRPTSRPPPGGGGRGGASNSNRNSHHSNNNYTQQTHSSPHNKPPFGGNNSNNH